MREKKKPFVSVVIASLNRAELLRESMASVLNQSFRDLELIVVDDGSDDNTEGVVRSFGDPRVRYFRTGDTPRGISAARNLGARESRGEWTAVHDDDDLMLPHRLENQIKRIEPGIDFIYGAFVNFNNETAELQLHHGRNMTYGAALQTGFAPGHSTWLVRTDLIRQFGYDEGLESAVDNNLAFRFLRSGIEMVHSGDVCLLRRVHSGRITDTGGAGQKYAAELNLRFLQTKINSASRKKLWKAARYDWGPVDKESWEHKALYHLPDHLVRRSGQVFRFNKSGNGEAISIANEYRTSVSLEEFFQLSAEGSYLGEVRVRLREDDEIEQLVASQTPPPSNDDGVARAIAYYVGTNSGAKYIAIGLRRDHNERSIGSNIVSFVYDGTEYVARGFEDIVSVGQQVTEWERDGLSTWAYEANGTPW